LERQNYQALDILNSIIVLPDDGDLFFSDLSFIHVFLNLRKQSIRYYIWLDFGLSETQLIMFWLSVSDTANPSYLKARYPDFFFHGDANDPNVQAVIKTNSISLMTSSVVPPFFCLLKPDKCNADNVEVFAGSGITKYKKV